MNNPISPCPSPTLIELNTLVLSIDLPFPFATTFELFLRIIITSPVYGFAGILIVISDVL